MRKPTSINDSLDWSLLWWSLGNLPTFLVSVLTLTQNKKSCPQVVAADRKLKVSIRRLKNLKPENSTTFSSTKKDATQRRISILTLCLLAHSAAQENSLYLAAGWNYVAIEPILCLKTVSFETWYKKHHHDSDNIALKAKKVSSLSFLIPLLFFYFLVSLAPLGCTTVCHQNSIGKRVCPDT